MCIRDRDNASYTGLRTNAVVLRPLIAQDAILCTDGARVYQAFARLTGIAHRPINVKQGIRVLDGAFHIQNLSLIHI